MLLVVIASSIASICSAQDADAEREAQLKAAYLFNFVKFVDWEARAGDGDLDICFTGADEVRAALAKATASKSVGSRQIRVRAVNGVVDERCEVIYVKAADTAATHWAVQTMALTVGDAADFTQGGGVIRLYTEGNRLRFAINLPNARRAGLSISSNLLKLATLVEQ